LIESFGIRKQKYFPGGNKILSSYSKTNQMHQFLKFFYFVVALYMFRTVFQSIIRSLRLYIQHHTIQVLWLLSSGNGMEHLVSASKQSAESV